VHLAMTPARVARSADSFVAVQACSRLIAWVICRLAMVGTFTRIAPLYCDHSRLARGLASLRSPHQTSIVGTTPLKRDD
jgi:hypothetical protein